MTTPTPRTYTQAEMDRVLDDLNEAIIFQITMKVQHERDLAAAKAELRIEREASNVWQDHLEVAKQDLAAAQEARQAAEALAESYKAAMMLAFKHIDMEALKISHCKDAVAIQAAIAGEPK